MLISDVSPLYLALKCNTSYGNNPDIKSNGTEVLIEEREDCIIIAFRGTDDVDDVITDISIWPTYHKGTNQFYHKGFLEGTLAVWPYIKERLDDRPLIITGHSKGGAEATIATALAISEGYIVIKLVTFGCPRVGYRGLTSYLEDIPQYRYKNENDAVTAHPRPLWGYKHTSTEIRLGGEGKTRRYRSHGIKKYIEALRDLDT